PKMDLAIRCSMRSTTRSPPPNPPRHSSRNGRQNHRSPEKWASSKPRFPTRKSVRCWASRSSTTGANTCCSGLVPPQLFEVKCKRDSVIQLGFLRAVEQRCPALGRRLQQVLDSGGVGIQLLGIGGLELLPKRRVVPVPMP